MTARLGMDEDSYMDIYFNRTMLAYEAVADIRATTVAGLLCQVRAWWTTYEGHSNIQIPDPAAAPVTNATRAISRRPASAIRPSASGRWTLRRN